jgi:hypothetical protein
MLRKTTFHATLLWQQYELCESILLKNLQNNVVGFGKQLENLQHDATIALKIIEHVLHMIFNTTMLR